MTDKLTAEEPLSRLVLLEKERDLALAESARLRELVELAREWLEVAGKWVVWVGSRDAGALTACVTPAEEQTREAFRKSLAEGGKGG